MVANQLQCIVNVCKQKHSVGVASYSYHLETCRELFETREGMKTDEERVPLPEDPFAGLSELPSLEKMNEMALEVYRSRSSAVCPFCDRSFRDRELLEKHNIICSEAKPLRKASLVGQCHNRQRSDDSHPCAFCGRTFKLSYQLDKHHIICTAEKPLRKPTDRRSGTGKISSGQHADTSTLDTKDEHIGNSADAGSFHTTDISLAGEIGLFNTPLLLIRLRVCLQ